MKHGFLRKSLALYLSTGVLAGIMCLACLLLLNYKKSLEDWLTQFSSITVKTVKMKASISQMHQVMTALHALYPPLTAQTGRQALLAAADETRRMLKGSDMTLGDITAAGGELLLPAAIRLDGAGYADIASCLGYLQTRIIPCVSIERLALEQTGGNPSMNRLAFTLTIFFRIPDDGKSVEASLSQGARNTERRMPPANNDMTGELLPVE